jgi:hypothetical protein
MPSYVNAEFLDAEGNTRLPEDWQAVAVKHPEFGYGVEVTSGGRFFSFTGIADLAEVLPKLTDDPIGRLTAVRLIPVYDELVLRMLAIEGGTEC